MFGCVDEANAMARVRKKRSSRFHRGQMAAFAFDTQVLLDVALLSHQTDQRFRLMGIELISDKEPGGLGIGLDGLGNVSNKVGFGACCPRLGATTWPVAASRFAIRLKVPCRSYSNSWRST